MYANGFISSLDRIAIWITRMVILNLVWVLYTLLGLLVGGFFPATVAALGIVRKWLMGDHDIDVWGTFRQIYRQEFVLANGLGWILTGIGIVLLVNFQILEVFSGQLPFIVPFAYYLLIFFYSLVVIWSFPLKAHYHAGILQQIKNAFILGLTKIHVSIAIFITLFAIVYFSLEFPTLILFFLFSLSALTWFWFTFRVFIQLDSQ